jgi:hypothetical protein
MCTDCVSIDFRSAYKAFVNTEDSQTDKPPRRWKTAQHISTVIYRHHLHGIRHSYERSINVRDSRILKTEMHHRIATQCQLQSPIKRKTLASLAIFNHHQHVATTTIESARASTLRHSFCFPAVGFTSYWTLSSKFFSTFPHGTCLLSVLLRYLALEGVYLLI